ncbi:MAG TPA: nucleoside phosphorylase [Nitrososphaerales archaeon]|nr:nucleoside phosphorylase [Nitrososphaerales archaeon]
MAEQPKDDGGRPYHVRISKKDAGRIALLPGDPGRVPKIAERFRDAKDLGSNREYRAFGGRIGDEKVVAVSTGIGGPAAAIAIEELARLGVKVMIRVGSCGAIAPDIRTGSVIIADAAVRMDGTSAQYVPPGYPAAASPEVVMALTEAAKSRRQRYAVGLTASTDAFYVGQGRQSFGGYLPPSSARLVEDMRSAKVICFEMEAATLFTLGRIFGLKTGAVFAVVANRTTNELRHEAGVDDAIDTAVGAVSLLKKYDV